MDAQHGPDASSQPTMLSTNLIADPSSTNLATQPQSLNLITNSAMAKSPQYQPESSALPSSSHLLPTSQLFIFAPQALQYCSPPDKENVPITNTQNPSSKKGPHSIHGLGSVAPSI